VPGHLKVPPRKRRERGRELAQGLLAARLQTRFARIEQDVVRQHDDHAAAPQGDLEIPGVDHALELQRELAKQGGTRLCGGLGLAQLVQAGPRLLERARERTFRGQELVGVLAVALELGVEVLIDGRRLVERALAGECVALHALEVMLGSLELLAQGLVGLRLVSSAARRVALGSSECPTRAGGVSHGSVVFPSRYASARTQHQHTTEDELVSHVVPLVQAACQSRARMVGLSRSGPRTMCVRRPPATLGLR
jgi:hypothetical protein